MKRYPRPGLTLVECLAGVAMIVAGISGAVWGYREYGVWGAVLGVPLGVILGLLAFWLAILAVIAVVFAGLAAWAVYRRGPCGLVLLGRYGPDGVVRGGPPRGPTESDETNQPNDAGG